MCLQFSLLWWCSGGGMRLTPKCRSATAFLVMLTGLHYRPDSVTAKRERERNREGLRVPTTHNIHKPQWMNTPHTVPCIAAHTFTSITQLTSARKALEQKQTKQQRRKWDGEENSHPGASLGSSVHDPGINTNYHALVTIHTAASAAASPHLWSHKAFKAGDALLIRQGAALPVTRGCTYPTRGCTFPKTTVKTQWSVGGGGRPCLFVWRGRLEEEEKHHSGNEWVG